MSDAITLNHQQLVAIFAEWDRRAIAGNWPSARDAEVSADTFEEIARDLFPAVQS